MLKYMLNINIAIYTIKNKPGEVREAAWKYCLMTLTRQSMPVNSGQN